MSRLTDDLFSVHVAYQTFIRIYVLRMQKHFAQYISMLVDNGDIDGTFKVAVPHHLMVVARY